MRATPNSPLLQGHPHGPTLIQTASGKYHVGFDLSDHKDPAHNRDHTTNEFGKIKTLNIGAIPFELKFSRTPRYCRYVRTAGETT